MIIQGSGLVGGFLFKKSIAAHDLRRSEPLPQTLPPYIQEIGPILSEEYPPLTPELSDFINGHERVLYVSFGTLYSTTTDNNSKLLQLFIEAINKKIIDGVVWALVETPKDYFYPTLELSDGAGSAHESLYTGTPMLVLPFAGDQMGNAQKLVSAGVASSLKLTTLDVNDISNKMDSLLKEENVKNSSERLKVLAKINSIALSIIGIIVSKLIKFIGFIISPSDDQKSKKD
ncbi:unnamed protein product [Rhizophagus irregularis]|nr:unnamed protein product [Rhizophagus irregularis]